MARHIVVEEDRVLRLIGVVLDPDTDPQRIDAWADFVAHDEPHFAAWVDRIRSELPGLFPSRVTFVSSQEELREVLPGADGAVVEALNIGRVELERADRIRVVQKFGAVLRNIDAAECSRRGVPVRVLPRRQNIAVAEHAFALMSNLAKRIHEIQGVVTAADLRVRGFDPSPFDRRFMANSNYGRIPGLRTLSGSTVGVIGMGEIGSEFARRCAAFGMRVFYHQRTRLPAEAEQRSKAMPLSLEGIFEECDFVSLHLPLTDATRDIIDGRILDRASGTMLVNTSRAHLVEHGALIEALDSGRLAGFALDTGYTEPASDDEPLLGRANVLLTPHTAPASRSNGLEDVADLLRNLHDAFG